MAEFKFPCPRCGQNIQCDTGYAGIQINCPACKRLITTPQIHGSGAPTLQPPVPGQMRTGRNILAIAATLVVLVALVTAGWFGYSKYNRGHLPPGLVAHWSGEGKGKDSVSGNNGVLYGDVGIGPGKVGQAFSFNGKSSYIAAPDTGLPSGNSPRTVMFWMKWQAGAVGNNEPVVYGGPSGSDAFYVVVINGRLYIGSWGGGDTPGSTKAADGNWHHIGLTHDGTTTRMYVDGHLDAQVDVTRTTTLPGSLYIGALPSTPDHFKGQVDEVSVYNRALSASEIKAIYAKQK